MTLALIDYGAGNLHSVHNALNAIGVAATITADAEVVRRAERIILPGVGAFDAAMRGLEALPGMIDALAEAVLDRGHPFLGVCVGMQLLAHRGEEGDSSVGGLGWIGGTVRAIKPRPDVRVPHMGWNSVRPANDQALVQAGEAYFLHGYHFDPDDSNDVEAHTDHGGPIVAAVRYGSILGVQFHPEKSQRYGLGVLQRFMEWRP